MVLERQLVLLANSLSENYEEVIFLVYHDLPFFRKKLKTKNIKFKLLKSNNYLSRIFFVQGLLKKENPDVLISFLDTPITLQFYLHYGIKIGN